MIQQQAAKGLIENEDGEVLLLKASHDGDVYWDLPGGRIEDGETVSQTLARECEEEVSATVSNIGKCVGSFSFSFQYEQTTYSVTADVYKCIISNPDSLKVKDDEEVSTLHKYAWVHPDDFQNHSLGNIAPVLQSYYQ